MFIKDYQEPWMLIGITEAQYKMAIEPYENLILEFMKRASENQIKQEKVIKGDENV